MISDFNKPLFTLPLRVYVEDTDFGGVVFYANYLKYLERARTEWLRSLGISQQKSFIEQKILFVVSHVDIDYLASARMDDIIEVTATVALLKRASLVFFQEIKRNGEVLIRANVKIVCVNSETMKPQAIPAETYLAMKNKMT